MNKDITDRLDKEIAVQKVIARQLLELNKTNRSILKLLKRWSLPQPEEMAIRLLREEGDDMLVYNGVLPKLPDPLGDVVSQHLTVTANGVVILEADPALDATETGEFKVKDDDDVEATLTYTDDAGNVSAARKQSFKAKDTIPPDAPGEFGEFTLVREEP